MTWSRDLVNHKNGCDTKWMVISSITTIGFQESKRLKSFSNEQRKTNHRLKRLSLQSELLNDSRKCSALIALGREFHSLAAQYKKLFFRFLDVGVAGVSEIIRSTFSNLIKYHQKVLDQKFCHA